MEVRPGRWTHGHRRAQRASTSIGLQRPGAAEDLAADPGTQSVVLPAAAVGGQVRSAQMEIIDPTHSLPPRLSADGPSAVPPPGNPQSRSFVADFASVSGSVEEDSTADEGAGLRAPALGRCPGDESGRDAYATVRTHSKTDGNVEGVGRNPQPEHFARARSSCRQNARDFFLSCLFVPPARCQLSGARDRHRMQLAFVFQTTRLPDRP